MTSTTATTVADLRFVADILAIFPGLPPVSVNVSVDWIDVQVTEEGGGADDNARAVAVDMLAAVLGAPPPIVNGIGSYGSTARAGDRTVHVYAPRCEVVREVPA